MGVKIIKIKVYSFPTDDINKGFFDKKIYDVKKISISGDYCAYDLFYYIENKQGNETSVFDLCCEIIEQESEIENMINEIEKLWRESGNHDIPFKFSFNINVEDFLELKSE